MPEFAEARRNMVNCQIRPNGVNDPAVTAALLNVPREAFVDEALKGVAYLDEDLALGGSRYLVEPLVFARLLQLAAPGPGDSVLDIGCGPGYTSAVIARLAASVVALDSEAVLLEKAGAALPAVGADNVMLVSGAMNLGHADGAPYDAIIIEGAVPEIPDAIRDQLAEGGRLVAVLSPPGQTGQIWAGTRRQGILSGAAVFEAATPPLPDFALEKGFVF